MSQDEWLVERWKIDWWPQHVQVVLAEFARLLGTRPLSPEIVDDIVCNALPDHEVNWSYIPAEELEEPEGVYALEIIGNPYGGNWEFREEHLDALVGAAARTPQ